MTVDEALDVVWREAARSSQEIIAAAIGVRPSILTGWKQGARPTGKNRAKLLAWAEGLPPATVVDVIVTAQQRTQENIVRLAEISGYAKSVLNLMRTVTSQQEDVVNSLAPWVLREEDAMLNDAEAKAATKKLEAALAQTPPTAAESSHPKTDAAAQNTAPLPRSTSTGPGSRPKREQ